MNDNLIEQAKKKRKLAGPKAPSAAPELYYGNLPPKRLEEEQTYRVRAPSAVTGVRG